MKTVTDEAMISELDNSSVCVAAPERRLYHVCERHTDTDPATIRRKEIAFRSWDTLYSEHGVIPCHLWESDYPRTAHDIGDPRALPYLKDVLENGMNQAGDEDVLFLSNDDVFLHSELPDLLRFQVSVYDACSSQRCEFRKDFPPAGTSPTEFARLGTKHLGRDLFAFKKKWLLEKWEEIPPFLLGCSEFDLCLAAMIRLTHGIKTTRANIPESIFPSELPVGYVAHLAHRPHWTLPNYINSSPGQKHNRALFRAFAEKHLPELKFTPENTI